MIARHHWKHYGDPAPIREHWPGLTDLMAYFQRHVDEVSVASRSIPPQWGPVRFLPAPRTYDAPPWGVRVVSQAKSRKIPTRNMLPLLFVSR